MTTLVTRDVFPLNPAANCFMVALECLGNLSNGAAVSIHAHKNPSLFLGETFSRSLNFVIEMAIGVAIWTYTNAISYIKSSVRRFVLRFDVMRNHYQWVTKPAILAHIVSKLKNMRLPRFVGIQPARQCTRANCLGVPSSRVNWIGRNPKSHGPASDGNRGSLQNISKRCSHNWILLANNRILSFCPPTKATAAGCNAPAAEFRTTEGFASAAFASAQPERGVAFTAGIRDNSDFAKHLSSKVFGVPVQPIRIAVRHDSFLVNESCLGPLAASTVGGSSILCDTPSSFNEGMV